MMLIPTLPDNALSEVKIHTASGKLAVHRIVEAKPLTKCANCADDGLVYVSFLGAGPSRQPVTTAKPSTYVAGDGFAKQGWYQIERTVSYACPKCSAQPRPRPVGRL